MRRSQSWATRPTRTADPHWLITACTGLANCGTRAAVMDAHDNSPARARADAVGFETR